MTLREWAVVTVVIVGIFAGLFAGAFWTAAIAGYMRCMDPREVLTVEQINTILALRDTGEKG